MDRGIIIYDRWVIGIHGHSMPKDLMIERFTSDLQWNGMTISPKRRSSQTMINPGFIGMCFMPYDIISIIW
jgi:hypothetical protein